MDGGEEGERGESEVDLPRETRVCAEMGLRVWEKPLYSKGSVLDTVTEKPRRRWHAHCRTCLPRPQEKLHWTRGITGRDRVAEPAFNQRRDL